MSTDVLSQSILPLLNSLTNNFKQQLNHLLTWQNIIQPEVTQQVEHIIQQIREQGDQALLALTQQFDHNPAQNIAELQFSQAQLLQAFEQLPLAQRQALLTAAKRIQTYHCHQMERSWQYQESNGTILGQKIIPLTRVGIYVPGGKASYPSSVLMNAVPAKVAGVDEIIMTVPAIQGKINPIVLAAAHVAQVDQCWQIGGAQAIAALAYGTESIAAVNKIVGPGNSYVAAAKRAVFGQVGIDMIAGPSEVLIISDGSAPLDWLIMDLFAQAEHDEQAQAMLISWDQTHLEAIQARLPVLLAQQPRRTIISKALQSRGALIKVCDVEEAIKLANHIAPEHLELAVNDPEALLPQIRHAGAIFMGCYSAEALGDYCLGPNHVLPTSGTARFSSPLGVYDFIRRSSIINVSAQGAPELAQIAALLADEEQLPAHAQAARLRI